MFWNIYFDKSVLTNTQKFKFPVEFQSRQQFKYSNLFILTFQNLEDFGMLQNYILVTLWLYAWSKNKKIPN